MASATGSMQSGYKLAWRHVEIDKSVCRHVEISMQSLQSFWLPVAMRLGVVA